MRRNFYLFVFCVLAFLSSTNAQNVLQESFEGTFPPTGWTLINAGSGNTWTQNTTAAYVYNGSRSMQYGYSSTAAANAWAFTPALSLAAGSTYSVTFYVRARSASFPESMKFTVGNTNTVAAQTTTLLDSSSISNITFRKWATTYTPSATGSYNFAFNCYSVADQFALYVDSVSIFNNNAPSCSGTPAAGTISGPSSVCSGISFALANAGASTTGTGLGYAWQSSANGTSGWTNIAGQVSPASATATQTATTYYRFVDTCTASGQSAISNVIQVTMNAPSACYCTPATNCDASDRIDSVSFVTIRNGSICSVNGYGDYTSQSAAISTGSSYPIAVKVGNGGTEYVGVWIDYDRNGTFDASEFTAVGSGNGVLVNGTITIPGGVASGTARMRVRVRFNTALTGADACLVYTYGETEDYTVSISPGSPCTGTPNGGSITPATTQLCASGSVAFSSTAANTGTGITYQWQSAAGTGTNFTNITGANAATYTATVAASTSYRVVITCTGSGSSANSSTATVTISGPPANDSFCAPIALTLDGASNCGNTTCATSGYDPAFANSTPNNTVWYTYTPTATGAVQAKFKRPAGVTTGLLYGWLGIYTVAGRCPGLTFTEVPSSLSYDLTTNDSVSVVTPSLTAGVTYYFMIDGFSSAFGAYCIQLLTPPPVPSCATLLAPANSATNVPNLFTLRWNKSANATSYDVYIGVANPPTGTPINATDTTLALSSTNPNTTFYWYVVPKNGTGSATGCNANVFSFTTLSTPANDSCGAAIVLTNGVATTGEITGATPSPAAAVTCGASTITPSNDVWYSIRARSNGTASVTVTANYGTGFNPVIAVYSGTCSSPVLINCSDASTTTSEIISLTGLVAGNTYLVRVFANGTVSNGGFTITATGPALPVTGVNLTATRNGKNVQLGWQTLTEANNAGFELQRSADGSNFTSFLNVASKANGGNSTAAINYTADDVKPFSGASYYRLKQTDKDGKISYSNVVYLKGLAVSNLTLSAIYPNPTHDVLKAAIQSPTAEKITFVICDMMGKVISRQAASVVNGDNTINLNVASLPSGNYLLKAICSNGCETAVQKFTKQ